MVDPYSTGASRACDVKVTSSLARLLKQVNGRWSAISRDSKFKIGFSRYGFISFLELSYSISIFEDDYWVSKGKYSVLINGKDQVTWVDEGGVQVIYLLAVGL